MDQKAAAKFLSLHAPGWKDAAIPRHFIKNTTDPKYRSAALVALDMASQPKPKTAKTKPKKTTTKKEG